MTACTAAQTGRQPAHYARRSPISNHTTHTHYVYIKPSKYVSPPGSFPVLPHQTQHAGQRGAGLSTPSSRPTYQSHPSPAPPTSHIFLPHPPPVTPLQSHTPPVTPPSSHTVFQPHTSPVTPPFVGLTLCCAPRPQQQSSLHQQHSSGAAAGLSPSGSLQ